MTEHVLLEEQVLVISVSPGPLLEALVLSKNVVGTINPISTLLHQLVDQDVRQHHEGTSLLILKLLRSFPLLPHPPEVPQSAGF